MKSKDFLNYVFIAMLIITITIPLVTFNMAKGLVSVSERRPLAAFPVIFDNNGKLNPSAIGSLVNFVRDNIGLRPKFISAQATVEYMFFHKSPNQDVELGKDKWLFYSVSHETDIARGRYPLDNNMLDKISKNMERLDRICAEHGSEFVMILPTSKASIYPEQVEGGNYTIRETPVDKVASYLRSNSSVKFIEIKQALIDAKQEKQVYFKTDTHWNFEGGYVAYTTIINRLNDMGLMDTPPIEVKLFLSKHQGDLSAMLGNDALFPPENIMQTDISIKDDLKVKEGAYYNLINELKVKNNVSASTYLYSNPARPNAPRILLIGDSMFANWGMTQALAENSSDSAFVWGIQMKNQIDDFLPLLLDTMKPDIVLFESGERDLNLLATDGNRTYKP